MNFDELDKMGTDFTLTTGRETVETQRQIAAQRNGVIARVAELEAQLATLSANAEEDKGAIAALRAEIKDICEHRNHLSAQLTGTKNMLSGQTKRANKYAELHATLVRESGPALVRERERVAALEAALKRIRELSTPPTGNIGDYTIALIAARLRNIGVVAEEALEADARQSASEGEEGE